MLDVSFGHKIFYRTYGNPKGIPIVFIHGGPGGRSLPSHEVFFDPEKWFVIFYDQRGCGKSEPFASIKNNNTALLVDDLEVLRKKLNIEKWVVFGGSWGSTLALYYGICFPDRCLGFLLRGIFLGTISEINWFLLGMRKFFPEAHTKFLKGLKFSENIIPKPSEIFLRAKKLIYDKDPSIYIPAAEAWSSYESSCSTIEYSNRSMTGASALSLAKIEIHYFENNCFLKTDEIIRKIYKLKDHPVFIIQGRHDVICPPFTAIKLNTNLENSFLTIVENTGHSAFEEENISAIKRELIKLYNFIN